MLKSITYILQQLFVLKTKMIFSIEFVEIRDNEIKKILATCVLLKKKKNTINIEKHVTEDNIEKVTNWVNINTNKLRDIPIVVTINSDRIINKVAINDSETIKDIISNQSKDDFIIQKTTLNSTQSLISIARKDHINEIINQLHTISNSIINVTIGPSAIFQTYKTYFKPDQTNTYSIILENYSLLILNNIIKDIKVDEYNAEVYQKTKHVQFDTEIISHRHVITFSEAVLFYLNPLRIPNNIQSIKNQKENFIYKALSKPILAIASILILCLLLISSISYSILYNKNANTEQELSLLRSKLMKQQQYNKVNEDKIELLKTNGILESNDISFYSDQITKSIPDYIYLSKMVINPPKSTDYDNSDVFESNKILVYGNCYSSKEINDWINALKNNEWISNINLINYKQDISGELGSFCFEIIKQ